MDDKKIKIKYKQLKYQHLKKMYQKNLSPLPTNCKYNKSISLPNKHKINICSFNLEENFEIDLCYKPEHAKNCNAFCPKKSKEDIHLEFLNDVRDDQVRATNYKDINTLYWLYPELKFEEFPEKNRWYFRFYYWFKNLLKF
jgi:hypothetical protein